MAITLVAGLAGFGLARAWPKSAVNPNPELLQSHPGSIGDSRVRSAITQPDSQARPLAEPFVLSGSKEETRTSILNAFLRELSETQVVELLKACLAGDNLELQRSYLDLFFSTENSQVLALADSAFQAHFVPTGLIVDLTGSLAKETVRSRKLILARAIGTYYLSPVALACAAEVLRGRDTALQMHLLAKMKVYESPDSEPVVLRLRDLATQSEDPALRAACVRSLREGPSIATTRVILDRFLNDSNESVRLQALESLPPSPHGDSAELRTEILHQMYGVLLNSVTGPALRKKIAKELDHQVRWNNDKAFSPEQSQKIKAIYEQMK